MPAYNFICKNCDDVFEIVTTSITQYTGRGRCPKCKKLSKTRSFQHDQVIVGSTGIRTLGALADKNASKMSTDQKVELFYKQNAYKYSERAEPLPGCTHVVNNKPSEKAVREHVG